jgi:thiol-disulfide isomerase/thioredoxin
MPARFARALLIAVLAAAACRGNADSPAAAGSTPPTATPSGRLQTPYPIAPFTARDIDGRDVSFVTWKGKVVVVNVWATWCAPCRREMPALAALQDKYRDRLLVIGLLQDNVTTEFARESARTLRANYPIVRSTFEIESRFPAVLALPMTFVIDSAGRLTAMFVGEVDPASLEQELLATFGASAHPAKTPSKHAKNVVH